MSCGYLSGFMELCNIIDMFNGAADTYSKKGMLFSAGYPSYFIYNDLIDVDVLLLSLCEDNLLNYN